MAKTPDVPQPATLKFLDPHFGRFPLESMGSSKRHLAPIKNTTEKINRFVVVVAVVAVAVAVDVVWFPPIAQGEVPPRGGVLLCEFLPQRCQLLKRGRGR